MSFRDIAELSLIRIFFGNDLFNSQMFYFIKIIFLWETRRSAMSHKDIADLL